METSEDTLSCNSFATFETTEQKLTACEMADFEAISKDVWDQ